MGPQDATSNSSSIRSSVTNSLPSVANNDPIGNLANSQRVTQQQVQVTAVPPKFVSPVQQWPQPQTFTSVTLNDLKEANSSIGDGIGGNPGSVAAISMKFVNNNSTLPVMVQLCATLFIDGTGLENSYPFGQSFGSIVQPLQWNIERIKMAHFAPDFDSANPVLNVNQPNQDSETFLVKYLGSGVHEIFIFYYWRSIGNFGSTGSMGGSSTLVQFGQ